MKLRGALGGLNLLIETTDTPEAVTAGLLARREMLSQKVTIELAADADAGALEAAFTAVRESGGQLGRVRAAREQHKSVAPSEAQVKVIQAAAPLPPDPDSSRTEILQHGLRAGFRGEYGGSVVVLGDVNPGAELIAAGDVIVMGVLRGVVHAGALGRTDAIVYARPIASAQIRIADALARRAEDNSMGAMKRMQERPEAELARLQDGIIQIESYQPQRS